MVLRCHRFLSFVILIVVIWIPINARESKQQKDWTFRSEVDTSTEWHFTFSGDCQTFTAPFEGSLEVDLYGAQGSGAGNPGLGGHLKATLSVQAEQQLHVVVGGQNGFNGGAGNGGGASDIRLSCDDLYSRLVVAGGGGGPGYWQGPNRGGDGGGLIGGSGCLGHYSQATGGNQTSGGSAGGGVASGYTFYGTKGSLGYGGNSCPNQHQPVNTGIGGGGGGGYFGGGGGCFEGSGGGGSSYAAEGTILANLQGVRSGNGLVSLRYPSVSSVASTTVPPSPVPMQSPTETPSSIPTVLPSSVPTQSPSSVPTPLPSSFPSSFPTQSPTHSPSTTPTPI